MRSLPIFGLGVFFALAGIGLFAFTMRKQPSAPTAPVKKSELREQAVRQTETNKIRIAATISVIVGAGLMLIS